MRFAPVLTIAALVAPLPAFAHPKLVLATPAANAATAPTARVQLVFSERLIGQFSSAEIVMTEMAGMKMHGPMKMSVKASVAGDGKTLVLTLAKPLPKGSYRVDWHVVSADTHRVQGNYSFKVQ
ncbi:copper homeostasis periplasmic binding protein CopC [Sphingomonas sp. Root241]|uniref:copper homeostasis periplasmic binding protein CopC n=1 Tax=Sphingomonas sp. Root241 TaxID=1736501 RepID=UPI0006F8E344|nr:copper homeostasis periplasmic binding protein CopC [Sphingomonas sp. Root241]KRC81106.1 copper resistance protein CopC [Sphingomonas sp. Root241]